MKRTIIEINEDKCNGCGACAEACHEGAIVMENGKAKLIRDDYCDGLGDCLPVCPAEAISFVEREAAAYNEEAVKQHKEAQYQYHDHMIKQGEALPCGCAGSESKELKREDKEDTCACGDVPSRLGQWPVQIKLVAVNAPYFEGANLLIAADCTAYAYGNFHNAFMKNRITLIGCPKLDGVDYAEKLTAIIRDNNIKSVTVARMQVACCGGLENAVKKAIKVSGKFLPWQIVTISSDGRILPV